MPIVSKQRPLGNGQATRTVANSSILDQAVEVGSVEGGELIRMVVYGTNRVGKTTLSCCFPKPLLLIAFEPNPTGGSRSVRNIPGVKYLRLTSSDKGLQLCKEIQSDPGRYATYVVDGATSYQDLVLCEVMGWDEVPEQLSFGQVPKEKYQERAEMVKRGLRPFLNLPGHVVILAKEKDHNPPRDDYASLHKLTGGLQMGSYFAEDVGGSVAGWLHDACDYICRLYVANETVTKEVPIPGTKGKDGKPKTKRVEQETGRKVRRLLTTLHPNFAAGMRSANPGCVPEYVEGRTPQELYDRLMQVIDGTYKIAAP